MNYAATQNRTFVDWLAEMDAPPVHLRNEPLDDPTDYGAIHAAALRALEYARKTFGADADISIHVSPGTPAMQAVWVLLAKDASPRRADPVACEDRGANRLRAVRHCSRVRARTAARRR